ncbi:MAG: YlxR family protein [Clostridia bacterium]|nr:YlxR family protein [Clostridia bacterium]
MEKKVPMRRCVSCMRMFPKKSLLRIARQPDGTLKPDPMGKLNGRGAYLCTDPDCLKREQKSGRIARALGVTLTPEDREAIERALKEKSLEQN